MLWGILLFILVISAITALTNYNNKSNGKQPINVGVLYKTDNTIIAEAYKYISLQPISIKDDKINGSIVKGFDNEYLCIRLANDMSPYNRDYLLIIAKQVDYTVIMKELSTFKFCDLTTYDVYCKKHPSGLDKSDIDNAIARYMGT